MTKLTVLTHVEPISYYTLEIPLLLCSCNIILRTNEFTSSVELRIHILHPLIARDLMSWQKLPVQF
ncbi:hypothetical protein JHK86_003614 [Glycine max]|nr:hypothetical protein JHK86_003614 [Glycine max]